MNKTNKVNVVKTAKKQIRKVEPRRWEKAIAPNHNNHSHHSIGSVKLVGWEL